MSTSRLNAGPQRCLSGNHGKRVKGLLLNARDGYDLVQQLHSVLHERGKQARLDRGARYRVRGGVVTSEASAVR
jgi:hypothetical protein